MKLDMIALSEIGAACIAPQQRGAWIETISFSVARIIRRGEGKRVKGNLFLAKGTVIATFVDGKYPNLGTGNHAAFYVSQDAVAIWVIDQWSTSKTIQSRRLAFKGKDKDGRFVSPSNNGDAFLVIE